MSTLLIATNNSGKLEEMQALLPGFNAEIIAPLDMGLSLDVLEDGTTYLQNASRKANAYRDACRKILHASGDSNSMNPSSFIILADDSGLEVDALNGAPGIHSARYAPQADAKDVDRRRYLLQMLQSHPHPWTAHFHCTLAFTTLAGPLQHVEGRCPGEIISEERGSNGFGYDPIFLLPELGLTMAELPMQEKNLLSHRARAVMAARPILENILGKINHP